MVESRSIEDEAKSVRRKKMTFSKFYQYILNYNDEFTHSAISFSYTLFIRKMFKFYYKGLFAVKKKFYYEENVFTITKTGPRSGSCNLEYEEGLRLGSLCGLG